ATLSAKYAVKEVRDLLYRPLAEGEDAAKNKNKLDLYLPEGVHDFPVMLFIHGGAWVFGDKDQFGLYHNLATYWARRGIGVVVANYRLSPGVKHPAHVQDVAKAFAWTKANIANYGGDVHQLFVSGQSAGGHLVSLLATDESYLKAEGAKINDIRGVLTLSGVYGLPASSAGGGLAAATGVPAGHDGGQAKRTPFSSVFGSDPKALQAAAPINHLRSGLPPFLVLYAQNDPKILRDMAVQFAAALKKTKQEVDLVEAPARNHITELVLIGQKDDPVAAAMTQFLRQHAKLP
ncbi:MAG TPA: alpha/beta hydrolase, partial [Gemmataceae bacterium]|nr:alpha/beta hydrolase [Gemmataceae bacterium]